MISHPFDPVEHEVIDLPFVASLRRDSGIKELIVYHHRSMGSWVISLKEHDDPWRPCRLLDVAVIPCEDGQPVPTREMLQSIVHRLHIQASKAEVRAKIRRYYRDQLGLQEDHQRELEDSRNRLVKFQKNRHGPLAAERLEGLMKISEGMNL